MVDHSKLAEQLIKKKNCRTRLGNRFCITSCDLSIHFVLCSVFHTSKAKCDSDGGSLTTVRVERSISLVSFVFLVDQHIDAFN